MKRRSTRLALINGRSTVRLAEQCYKNTITLPVLFGRKQKHQVMQNAWNNHAWGIFGQTEKAVIVVAKLDKTQLLPCHAAL